MLRLRKMCFRCGSLPENARCENGVGCWWEFWGRGAGDASIKSSPGEIDRIVFLGAAPNLPADGLKSRALFIVANVIEEQHRKRLPSMRSLFACAIRKASSACRSNA